MRRALVVPVLLTLACLFPACSGNAVVEPGAKTSKRAKAFLEKCNPPPAEGVGELEEVYACIPAEEACPEAHDPVTETELGYLLNKYADESCGTEITVYDVPCGPDLNAIDCCYVARMQTSETICGE